MQLIPAFGQGVCTKGAATLLLSIRYVFKASVFSNSCGEFSAAISGKSEKSKVIKRKKKK